MIHIIGTLTNFTIRYNNLHACAITLHAGSGSPVVSAAQCEVMDEDVRRKNKKMEIDRIHPVHLKSIIDPYQICCRRAYMTNPCGIL